MIWSIKLMLIVTFCSPYDMVFAQWIPKEAAQWAVKTFRLLESERSKNSTAENYARKIADRRPSNPFITGDGFRQKCMPYIWDNDYRHPSFHSVPDGACVFVKNDYFEHFMRNVTPQIPHRYVLISHNGDMSAPDGQNDCRQIKLKRYKASSLVAAEYARGKLLAHHSVNLWWLDKRKKERPVYEHCLPLGLENRDKPIGQSIHVYVDALQSLILGRKIQLTTEQQSSRPLLLVSFTGRGKPDRQKALDHLHTLADIAAKCSNATTNSTGTATSSAFFNQTGQLTHAQWLQAITEHRFVLAPFGVGLDTFRVSEILMMGGVPVMRRSTITSCYDDTDNHGNGIGDDGRKRGSLPIVVLDSWSELNQSRLESEWLRISSFPSSHWDWRRLFIDHWLQRVSSIGSSRNGTRNVGVNSTA